MTIVLPPVETTPLLVIRFTKKAAENPEIIQKVKDRLRENNIIILSDSTCTANSDNEYYNLGHGGGSIRSNSSSMVEKKDGDEDYEQILTLTTHQHELEEEAEHTGLVKKAHIKANIPALKNLKGLEIMEPFCVLAKEEFISSKDDKENNNNDDDDEDEDDEKKDGYDDEGLFTSSDRVRMILGIIESLPFFDEKEESALKKEEWIHLFFDEEEDEEVFEAIAKRKSQKASPKKEELGRDGGRRQTLDSSFSKSFRSLTEYIIDDDFEDGNPLEGRYLIDVLKEKNMIDLFEPVHVPHLRNKVTEEVYSLGKNIPLTSLRDYYGEEVTYYFAWIEFYMKALIVPGMSGLLVFLLRIYEGTTIDDCKYTPFHGLVTFFWAILFLKFWAREEKKLAYKWGTFDLSNGVTGGGGVGGGTGQDSGDLSIRHEFKGKLVQSEVTGKMEKYYPDSKRRLKFLGSFLVTVVLLGFAFFFMILSLNLQGYIHDDDYVFKAETGKEVHPFYFPSFAVLAEEGNLFDAKSDWMSFVPVILHVSMVLMMNSAYRRVARRLTTWENHRTHVEHQNSLVIKRFCFEAFDAYLVLFYLAFYEQDMMKLRGELSSLFHVDTVRRVLLEGVVPYVLQMMAKRKNMKQQGQDKKTDDKIESKVGSKTSPILEEMERDEYEQFDDYIEMVIQLGYVTLFASAYPMSSFIAIMANSVEYRLDAFKLAHTCVRPHPVKRASVGIWFQLMKIIVWMSALTNCLIFTFTSMQMYQYLPNYFTIDETGEHDLKDGNGWIVIFIIFGIERLLLVIGILLDLGISDVPRDVKNKELRRDYVYFQQHQYVRARSLKLKQEKLMKEKEEMEKNDDTRSKEKEEETPPKPDLDLFGISRLFQQRKKMNSQKQAS